MRAKISTLLGLMLLACGAQAQTSFQEFSWRANSRFELKIVQNGVPVTIQGDLRDGDTGVFPSKDQTVSAELKSYTTELFLVVAVTTPADESGSIFLLERPNADWMAMNSQAIRARKLGLMKDVEGVITAFKTVSNFGIAQSMRKMVEYFETYPTKRLNDLYDSLERGEEFVKALPKPRVSPRDGNQGIVQPEIPDRPFEVPRDEEQPEAEAEPVDEEELQRPSREELRRQERAERKERERLEREERERIERENQIWAPPVQVPQEDPNWVRQERERQRRWLEQQRQEEQRWREQQRRQQQPRYVDPFEPQPRRRPQYAPVPQYQPPRERPRKRDFLKRLFGGDQRRQQPAPRYQGGGLY